MSGEFNTLLVEPEGPVLWVRLNRPDVLNAYTAEMGAELALEIAANCSPVALALTRQMLWTYSGQDSPAGALAVDARLNIQLGAMGDVHEGVAAFLEKRAPQFPLKVSQDLPETPWRSAETTKVT